MALIVRRDKDDHRSTREVLEAVDEEIARKLTGRCTLFCGDVECPENCPNQGGK